MGEILENRGGIEDDEEVIVSCLTRYMSWNSANFERREYYERTNLLVQQYLYIDRLLDSSLPHDLLNEYNDTPGVGGSSTPRVNVEVPPTISEEPHTPILETGGSTPTGNGTGPLTKKVKRTPREIYKVSNEISPLIDRQDDDDWDGPKPEIPGMEDDSVESGDRIVQVAIYLNFAANAVLLAGKIAVIVLTSSLSVLASLVRHFLITFILYRSQEPCKSYDGAAFPLSGPTSWLNALSFPNLTWALQC